MKTVGRKRIVIIGLVVLVVCLLLATVLIVVLLRHQPEYQVHTGTIGTDNSCAHTTLLLSPNLTLGSSYNVNVAGVNQSDATANIAGNPDFALSWSKDSSGRPLAVVAMGNTANNQWKCTPTARQTLQTDFLDFYNQLWEQLEIQKKLLIPGGASLIMQRVADALPVTYQESLFYHYGFSSGLAGTPGPYVDLLPGMRLQLETETNQFISPTATALNGLVNNGQGFYQLGSFTNTNGKRLLTFNAFLGAISAPTIATKPDPTGANGVTASGLIDLQASGTARRYFRLFYPTQLPSASSTGSSGLNNNATLIGADTLADLALATTTYISSDHCATASAGNLSIECITFRGRTTLVPEIGIFVNQQQVYVPVGTTVRNIAESMFSANLRNWNDNAPLTFNRLWTDGTSNQLPASVKVNFNPSSSTLPDASAYELPLLMGDRFVFAGGN